MRRFAVARSAAMRSRDSLASIFSCATSTNTASDTVVAATICARRAVSSSGSILRNVSLVVTI